MFSRIKHKYMEFSKYENGNPVTFLYYLFLMRYYHTTMTEFFEYELFRLFQDHSAYYKTTTKAQHSWKNVKKQYFPDSKWWRDTFFFLDFTIARVLYPGLDTRDYFSYEFHSIRHAKRKTFITDGGLAKMDRHFNSNYRDPANADARDILTQKNRFNSVFSDLIGRKWIMGASDITDDALNTFCEGLSSVIVKPKDGAQGKRISKIPVVTDTDRGRLLEELKNGNFLAEEVIVQHPDIAAFNPASVNTIRIFSVLHNSEVHITGAVFRIGREGSITDNYSAGGFAAEIDVSSGIVISRAICKTGEYCYVHPDSNKTIIGFQIPCWDHVLETVKEAHLRVSALRYIGWDACITEENNVVLIEANTGGGVGLQQHPSLSGKKQLYRNLY